MTGVASLADIEAIESVPIATRGLPANTYAMLRVGRTIAPDAPALSFFLTADDHQRPHTLTHRALFAAITQAANTFRRLGIGRTDVVAFLLPNLPEAHLAIWGGEAAGIILAINPLLEGRQIESLLNAARAKILVTLGPAPGSDIWEKAAAAARRTPSLTSILYVDIARYVSGAAGLTMRAASPLRRPKTVSGVATLDFQKELARERADVLNFAEPASGDIASLFATGGTTGLPKLARRTHGSEVYNAWAMAAVMEGGFAPGRTIFSGLPLFHVNAQLVTGLAAFAKGAHVLMGTPQGYRGTGVLPRFWEIVERHRVNAFSGVPTVYSTLAQLPVGDRDIKSLDIAICGAAPMPVELFRRFEQATGVSIIEGYGLTEGACTSSVNPAAGEKRIGSIGLRLPYQDMRALVVDEAGAYVRDAAIGEVGALAIRGPNVFAGYVDPAHEAATWIERDGARWLNTGDLARQDDEGYFWLTGRKKELIIRGGHNIDPKVIEEALAAHPAVALCAAIGRPDAHAGEVPAAYVQLRPGAACSEAELADHAEANIPERAAVPKAIRIIDALPTTAVGKVFKPALAMREIEDVVRAEAAAASIELKRVAVAQDATIGMVARISCAEGALLLRARLERYAFAIDVTEHSQTHRELSNQS